MGEGGRERGEGLINGRRHAPESIAGREGRKSGETACRETGERCREVDRKRGDRTRSDANGRERESSVGRPQHSSNITSGLSKDVDGSHESRKTIKAIDTAT